jgi:FLVCR family MFS transporter 7
MRLLSLVRPDNTAALFIIMAVIGICTITMLPVALELACELTRNADGSSALIWFG